MPRGASTPGEFILDTGTTKSAVIPDIVGLVGLQTQGESEAISPGGRAKLPLVTVPRLEVMNHRLANLEANVEDLHKFSNFYQRGANGVLGMDVLQNLVTIIDYPRWRVALLEAHRKIRRMKQVAQLPLELRNGLMLVSADLPQNLKVKLVLDTGLDFPEDMALYKDVLKGLTLNQPLSWRSVGDAFSETEGESGQLPWVDFGDVRLAPVSVFMYRASQSNPFGTSDRPGLLGNGFLERYLVEIDGPGRVVRLFERPSRLRKRPRK